jgi:peroxiredoxin
MARKPNAPFLDAGDRFPALELTLTDGRRLTLPADLSGPYNVVLVNRGAWCPYCVAQLTAFQAGMPKLADEGIRVLSLSADPRDQTLAMAAEHRLQLPLAYGVSVDTVAGALGVYYEPGRGDRAPHLHSAGFLLGPDGRVLLAVYSSGAVGRLVWQDVLGYVRYVRSHP